VSCTQPTYLLDAARAHFAHRARPHRAWTPRGRAMGAADVRRHAQIGTTSGLSRFVGCTNHTVGRQSARMEKPCRVAARPSAGERQLALSWWNTSLPVPPTSRSDAAGAAPIYDTVMLGDREIIVNSIACTRYPEGTRAAFAGRCRRAGEFRPKIYRAVGDQSGGVPARRTASRCRHHGQSITPASYTARSSTSP
jgi:hypothetical protein